MSQNLIQAEMRFDERFLEQYLGKKLISDPVVATVELVANAWDAGAKSVDIRWPTQQGDTLIIKDDGSGMTASEFQLIWGWLGYNRLQRQEHFTIVSEGETSRARPVYGRNGMGRFAAYCFGPKYLVITAKEGTANVYEVSRNSLKPVNIKHVDSFPSDESGTTIRVEATPLINLRAETMRNELGIRFLTDPAFQVKVDGIPIEFEDIREDAFEKFTVDVPEIGEKITVLVLDGQKADRTARQHGVAWHVLGRLVGDCDWKDPEQRRLIDGRRVEAKRFTFIVQADFLHSRNAVEPDWSGFKDDNQDYQAANNSVTKSITERLLGASKEKRKETNLNIQRSFSATLKKLSPLTREKWSQFVDEVQVACPRLTESELKSVAGVLANMESSRSQYELLHKLHDFTPEQIDDLHKVLEEWTIDMAKIVLDELQMRLQLVAELELKTESDNTLEVQELQPLFHKGLWIFGPEYDTIEYTSNRSMTTVIQELFGAKEIKGSLRRPDFAILPDSSVGLYDYPEFIEDDAGEIGPARLVIVELKAPVVFVGDEEKAQAFKYVRELASKGLLTSRTKVMCFVLGKKVNPLDRHERTEMDGRVKILPIDYGTVLRRAKSRLLGLFDRIKSAPFLAGRNIEAFLADPTPVDELNFEEKPEDELKPETTPV
jgi:hypothetical protein